MARSIGDRVDPDFGMPDWVLADPTCPPAVREAREVIDAANAATADERAKVDAIRDGADDNASAIRRAIRDGAEPPAPIPAEVTAARIDHAETFVRSAMSRAYVAARACEAVIPQHRAELRAILATRLPEAAALAAKKHAEYLAVAEAPRSIAGTMENLDRITVTRTGTPAQRAAVESHYEQAHRRDPFNFPGVERRMPQARKDMAAHATGLPVDLIVPDPIAEDAAA
ncbi:hypothetical protein COUCH_00485 [Couchioplanes caeruleus]|uniref:hypothetical protein n=1 Tax=Couchioplanes caeruleus TaxID=56438 RepID=UPI0020BD5623|nr:hypothetical protein [Couchioplanes caeruleus]UQU64880.1 hypothetical protein COUCH_00485 [Couchioplanes caeruleus]